MSCLFKRNTTWWLQWDVDGVRKRVSLRTKDAQLARKLQRQHDAKLELRLIPGYRRPAPIKEAVAGWLDSKRATLTAGTLRWYRESSATLVIRMARIGIVDLSQVSKPVVERLLAHCLEAGDSPKTAAGSVAILRGMCYWAIDRGLLPADPVGRWPRPRCRPRRPERLGAYTGDEVARILDYARQRRPAIYPELAILAYVGCRYGELWLIRVADVDLPGRRIRITSSKTATTAATEHRTVEIHRDLVPVLAGLVAGKPPDDPLLRRRRTRNGLIQELTAICTELGIAYRRVHGLRASWITRMLAAGVPLVAVQRMCGHRSVAVTQLYIDVADGARGWVDRL